MVQTLFATKMHMGQAWTKSGKRVVVTKLKVESNQVVAEKTADRDGYQSFQIGYGLKKFKNMTKPLRTILNKSGFSFGVRQIREVKVGNDQSTLKVGGTIAITDALQLGDMVNVQGVTKGRGFGGVMKRHGFHGGPRTHGQSDRSRAPGSIGNRTTPGRVFKGKRMAGHFGSENVTVKNLQVVYINAPENEVWVSGPVPSFNSAAVRLTVVGQKQFEGLQNIESILETVTASEKPSTDEKIEALDKNEAKLGDAKEEVKEELNN